jgi:polyisoprenoid-binding protein YceI
MRLQSCLVGATVFLMGSSAFAEPVTYRLQSEKSLIYVQVFKDPDTLGAGLSHDHVVMGTGWGGTVTWDAANPAACKIEIKLPVRGLIIDEASMRKNVGYSSMLSEDQRVDVKKAMLGSDQLSGDKHSHITFASTGCEASGSGVTVSGNMTIRGQSSPVKAQMKITADGSSFAASGGFKTSHTQFGFDPFSAMFGQLKNKNEMNFTLDVKGTAQ